MGAGLTLGFIGLGVMGFPMAGHLAGAGHRVKVHNRSPAKAERWCANHPGEAAATPADCARDADMVFACVGADADVREVTVGPAGAFTTLPKGAVFIDHTTTSAVLARELSAVAVDRGFEFLDAPVSGGQAGAEQGSLTVMVGGPESAFSRAAPVIAHFARHAQLIGESGSGQLCKMVNQICIAGVVQGLAEGLNFASRAGLDGNAVVDVISKGAAQSWQMDNRAETMMRGKFDFGFAVDWMRKDLGIALAEAADNGARLEVAALVDRFYAEIQGAGGARWDTSSLITRL